MTHANVTREHCQHSASTRSTDEKPLELLQHLHSTSVVQLPDCDYEVLFKRLFKSGALTRCSAFFQNARSKSYTLCALATTALPKRCILRGMVPGGEVSVVSRDAPSLSAKWRIHPPPPEAARLAAAAAPLGNVEEECVGVVHDATRLTVLAADP